MPRITIDPLTFLALEQRANSAMRPFPWWKVIAANAWRLILAAALAAAIVTLGPRYGLPLRFAGSFVSFIVLGSIVTGMPTHYEARAWAESATSLDQARTVVMTLVERSLLRLNLALFGVLWSFFVLSGVAYLVAVTVVIALAASAMMIRRYKKS